MDVGFIGVGGVAQPHLDIVDGVGDAGVTAVCDVDEAAAREAAEPRDAAVYTDHEAFYRAEGDGLDAVFICIPPFAHTTQETMAAERGLPFLVEKPVALATEPAREVAAAVEDAGVVTQVGYQRRYDPLVERGRELLAGRQLALLEARRHSPVPGTPWWRVKERSGGQIVEMTTHDFDLLRHLAGEVERVTAYGGHEVVDEVDFEDAVVANMVHEGGAVSQVSSTSAAPDWHGDAAAVGDGVRLHWGDHLTGVVDGEEVDEASDAEPRRRQDRAFLDAVRADDPAATRSPYPDAVRTLELTLAVEEALATGDEVAL